jgi:uroporphyrinogen III methyltransferase/synthase
MGAEVDVVEAYRTVKPDREKDSLLKMFENGEVDMVTFTSSSTVKNFIEMFEDHGEMLKKWMKCVAVACIGPITAATAEEKGISVNLVPSVYTIEALTEEIVTFFSTPQPRR